MTEITWVQVIDRCGVAVRNYIGSAIFAKLLEGAGNQGQVSVRLLILCLD